MCAQMWECAYIHACCTFRFVCTDIWWLQPWNQKTLAPCKESYDKPGQHTKKQSHHITLLTKVYIVKAMVFPVVMYGWISELDHKDWMPKNWCSWIVILEKTLETPLDWKETNQSIQKEINPEHSLDGLMLNLKLQYFGPLMHRASSLEKTLMLGKIEGKRRRGQ